LTTLENKSLFEEYSIRVHGVFVFQNIDEGLNGVREIDQVEEPATFVQ
jgi:hypothetical protein